MREVSARPRLDAPSDKNDLHELFFMCPDVQEFVSEMQRQGIGTSAIQDQPWGRLRLVTTSSWAVWSSARERWRRGMNREGSVSGCERGERVTLGYRATGLAISH